MKVAKAKRRWIKWCRYVDKTQSKAAFQRRWGTETHAGQAVAYYDVMFARRYPPRGGRVVWYPKWGSVR